jgi:hypothetical protein
VKNYMSRCFLAGWIVARSWGAGCWNFICWSIDVGELVSGDAACGFASQVAHKTREAASGVQMQSFHIPHLFFKKSSRPPRV